MKNVKLLFLLLFAVNVWSHSANIANPPALIKNKAEVSVSTNTITIVGKQGEKFPAARIEGYLNQGKNVVFKADGNIVFNETIAKQSGATKASLTISSSTNGIITFGANALIASKTGKLDVLVQTKGSINMATSAVIVSNGGSIRLQAIEETGRLKRTAVSKIALMGTVDASSDAKGGKIFIESDAIQLHPSARVFAKGKRGGGTILIGGDWQGGAIAEKRETETIQQAISVKMDQGAVVDASATENGDGGKVVLWSNLQHPSSSTAAHGTLAAKGVGTSSKGGKIETSGGALQFENIDVSTIASDGTAGEWLLDPYNFYFDQNQLNTLAANLANSDITISTDTSSASGDPNWVYGFGHIVFQNNFNYTSSNNRTLTLTAKGDIIINGHIKSTGSGALNLIFNSQNNKRILIDYDIETKGGYVNFYNSPTVHFQKTNDTQTVNTAGGVLELGSSNVKLLRNSGTVVFNTGSGFLATGSGTIEQTNTRYAISGAVTKLSQWGGAHANGSKTYGVNVVAGREYSTRLYFWDSWDAGEEGQLFVRKSNGDIDYYFQGQRPNGSSFSLAKASNGAQFTASGVSNIGRTSNFQDQYVDITFVAANSGVFETWTNLNSGIDDESLEIYNIFETEFTESNYTSSASRSLELITTNGQIFGSRNINSLGSLIVNTGNDYSVLDGAISGSTSFIKNGSGIINLRGAVSYSGTSTVNSGTLKFSPLDANQRTLTGNFVNNSNVSYENYNSSNNSGAVALEGAISGNGTWNITSNVLPSETQKNRLILKGNTTISGAVTVTNFGNVWFEGVNFNATSSVFLNGANTRLRLYTDTVNATIAIGALTGTGNVEFSNVGGATTIGLQTNTGSSDVQFDGVISNDSGKTLSFIKNGSGTFTQTKNNTFGGTTTINAGTLVLQNDAPNPTNKTFIGSGQLLIAPLNTSFSSAFSTSGWSFGTGLTRLTFGKSGNTANITIGSATTILGPIDIYGGAIAVNAALTTPNNITLRGSGAITQTAAITAGLLELNGTGLVTLNNTSNAINEIAAGIAGARIGAINFVNNKALAITSYFNSNGVNSSGLVELATTLGDISVTQPINSSLASGDAVKLFANKGAAAGAAGNGNIKFSGSGSITIEPNARALLYSGSEETSLTTAIGGAANYRYNVADTTPLGNIIPAIGSTGKFGLLRAKAKTDLATLTLSQGTLNPAFAAATTSYTATVGHAITSMTITPTVSDANATVKVNGNPVTSGSASGAIPLNVGANTITTIVTAQDGLSTKTYTVTVTRAGSPDANLTALAVSQGTITPAFATGTTVYTASVDNAVTSVTITPTLSEANATVKVNTVPVTSGTAASVALIVGTNTINTVVIAQDGTTTKTYTVTITRAASANADLTALALSSGALSPTFTASTTAYTASVTNATTSITVTPTKSDATASITVNGATVTSGSASNTIALTVGTNTITTIVTAQNNTTKTYTVTVTRAASANADLTSLTLSQGTLSPSFAAATTNYTANVSNATTSITVTPTKADATASITVNGTPVTSGSATNTIALNVGNNTITTTVTAQDGTTTKSYTVTVNRAQSANANLAALSISSVNFAPSFAATTTSYTATVAHLVTSMTITPTVSDANATVKVNTVTVTSGTASGAITLNVGANTITTIVTAQDGLSTKTYTVTVTRAGSPDANLTALAVSQGTISPAFATGTTTYTASVANAVTSVTITPTLSEANATVKVNTVPVTSGTAASVALIVGTNTINTVVIAQDGTTTKTYTVTITRAASANADLTALALSSGALDPTFTASTTAYTASVTNATTSITVTPTKSDATASITVNGATVTSGSASGAIALTTGINTITTIVTAQNGTTKTYTVTVTRALSSNANLADLTLSQGTLSPSFAAATTNYTANVSNATTSITVTPTRADATASITVKGTTVASGSASSAIALTLGNNTITTTVTAQDGTTKTYTVTVNRAQSANANLAALSISSVNFAPSFAAATTSYTATVSTTVASVTVTPTKADPDATITVNGIPVNSAAASDAITLSLGSNTITTVVTAQNGATKTYTVTITKYPVPGNALAFDGTNDRVYASSPFPGTNMTLEAWIRTSASNSTQEIINLATASSNKLLEFRLNNNRLAVGTNGNSASTWTEIVGTTLLNTGKWTHVAVVKTGINYVLYVNGVADATGTINVTDAVTDIINIGAAYWDNTLRSGYTFNGSIDEVRVWNVAKTQAQIQAAMYSELNTSALPANLSNYYQFSADSGLTLLDLSGNNRNATLQNFSLSGTSSNWVESYAMVVPQSLTNTAVQSTSFTANWNAPTVGTVDNYVLEVATNANFSTLVAGYSNKNVGNVTSFEVTGLEQNKIHYWRVRANKATVTNQSAYQSQTVTTTKDPINVTSTTATNTFDLLTNSSKIVDPNIAVVSSQTIPGFKVSISSGKQDGDVLSYTGSLPSGVTATAYDAATGVLTFNGTTTTANWQALLRTVTFRGYKNGTGARGISFSAGTLNSFSNGHFYEYIPASSTSWTAAKALAADKTYLNYTGYLATVTSQAENDYIKQILSSDAWMGASDDYIHINAATGTTTFANQSAAEGKWHWVTGPEAGTQFMTSNGGTNVVAGKFANWANNEPNNYQGSEHYGQFYSSNNALWNDLPNTYSTIQGYLIEYGGLASDIVQTPSYSVTMNVTSEEPGNAMNFDGANDYVYASGLITNPTTFTLEAWFKTTTANGPIVGLNSTTANEFGNFDRFIWLNDGKVKFGVYNGASNTLSTTTNYNDGKYHHVAATFTTGTGAGMKLYVDGVLIGSNNLNTVNAYDGYWKIGGFTNWTNGTNAVDYFNGSIDEVKIWNTVRTLAEIQADLKNPAVLGTAGLTHYYSFNQGLAAGSNAGLTTLYDQTAANRNAVVNNASLSGASSNWVSSYAMVIPATIAATSTYSLGFTANWTAPSKGIATNYFLDVATDANFTALVAGYSNRSVGNVLTFDVSGLLPSTNYYYRVRAANATESNGVSSNITSVTTNAKETLVATAATNNSSVSFTANWTAPALHTIAAYLLDVATDANFTAFVSGYNGLSVTGLTKVVSGLTANTTYYYRVRVANYNNSNTITTNTKAPFAAIASNVNAVCINGTQPIITFTGSGSTFLPYTFTYSINGITQPTLVTSGSAETASIAVPTTTSGAKNYALISVKDGSGGSNLQSGNTVIAINALPVPTIVAAPATAVCTTTEVQYATQADQTDYVWTIAGVAGTDYQITAGSTASSSAVVTVKWLTAGNKNVSVRYTNSSGCMAIVPTVVTTTVTATPIVAAITGVTTTTAGLTSTLENATANGVWSSSNNAIAFINTTGTVTAIGQGTATITYTVTNGNCSTSVTTPFTVNVAPIPTLITISPLSGVVGSTVTVTGTNFSGTSIVTLDGVEVTFTVINNTTISVIVPSGTTGGVIVVTTPGGTATSQTFTVLSQALPTITSFTPTSAGAGQTVTITGTNLLNASEVTFGSTTVASYTVVSNTSITAQIGIGATGSVSITTPGGIATKEGFTFINCTNPSVYAGDSVALCTSDTLINIGQSATAADYTTLVWTTSGTGTFANNTTATALTTATYTLSAADKASGSVTLTLTATAVAGCTNAVSSKTLTISPASVAGTIAITTSIATGTNSATVSLTGSIGAVQWQSGTDGISFTNINSATSATYVASNITATTYYRAVVSNGVCSPVTSAMVLVTVPTAPTANAQALCAGSTINNLVATGTNLKWYAAATGGTAQATTTALATGTYYVSQTVGAVESARTSVLVSIENTTWNGTAWSNGLPTATKGVIISGNFTAEATITACSLTVNNGAIVVIKSGVNLEIANQVDVAVGASLTFENNANLIQINDVANTGNAIVKRDSNPLYRLDYTLWSAPVTNANAYLAPFSPLTSNAGTSIRFYTYDAASSLYTSVLSAASTPFALGKGYLIRMPNEDPAVRGTNSPYFKGTTPIVFKGQFTGVLNNGTINLSGFTPSSYNAIGNPYPSAINADTFIKSNAGTGTLYFWRNKNSDSGSSYATYTLAGAVANGGYTPNGSIAVGQGFITKAPSSGTITFTNAMRASTVSTPATFLRTKAKTTAKKDKIWLNLSKGNSQVNQILLAYMDGATTGVDADIDGKYINDSPNALTWDINNEEYVIQGRPEFTDTDLVPLIFKTNVAGDYTIAKDKVEGVFAIGQAVYLVDTVTGTQTNLQTTAYNFTTAVGTFNSRFKLVYRTDNSLGVNELIQDQNNIVVYKQNAVLNIDAGSTIIKYVKVFDLGGRLLLEQKAVNATTSVIENLVGVHQVLMIQITTDDNKTITKKVIY